MGVVVKKAVVAHGYLNRDDDSMWLIAAGHHDLAAMIEAGLRVGELDPEGETGYRITGVVHDYAHNSKRYLNKPSWELGAGKFAKGAVPVTVAEMQWVEVKDTEQAA